MVQQAFEGLDQLQVRCGRDIVPPSHCLVIPVMVGQKKYCIVLTKHSGDEITEFRKF